jgi:hypothetical protein
MSRISAPAINMTGRKDCQLITKKDNMSGLSIYEIAHEYREVCNVLMDAGVDEQTLADTLEGERWALEVKAQNYGFVIRNIEATAEAIKEAEGRMAARRKTLESRAAYLLERLKTGMEIAGVSKIDSPYFNIAIKSNPPSVDIFEPALIPAELYKQPPAPAPYPDKTAIKAAIKAGQEVPGAMLVQGTRLEIK